MTATMYGSDWWLQARMTTTEGKGVGRWRNYFRCEDMADVNFRVRDLVLSAQIRVVTARRPQEIIVPPQRAVHYRLELLREQITAECISYGELAELQDLSEHIQPGDVQLAEWAGIPEEEFAKRGQA